MDFFSHQDRALRNSKTLVALFVLAVVCMVAAIYAIAIGVFEFSPASAGARGWWNPQLLAAVAGGTLLVVGCGTGYRLLQLRAGGQVVARLMGARPVQPNTRDQQERTLINVVEEISVASGVPVPGIYIMDEEPAINAFAAGYAPGDAVVAVTRGTLAELNRDELQGVVAHEFSHILNGDMRLNIRLMGVLHGILCVALAGYMLLRSGAYHGVGRRRSDRGGGTIAVLALGAGLVAVGYIGVFFARLIQSAVSRQREFLADASAVQFTRNPAGIAGALRKIGGIGAGSRMHNAQAEAASHMFFSSAVSSAFAGWFATHPPLPERIQRIERGAALPDVASHSRVHDVQSPRTAGFAGASAAAAATPEASERLPSRLIESVGHPTDAHLELTDRLLRQLPLEISSALHEPFAARALVLSLLLSGERRVREAQLELLGYRTDEETVHRTAELRPTAAGLDRGLHLILIDLCLPALRDMSYQQYGQFRRSVRGLIDADGRIDLWEFTLHKVLLRHLATHFDGPADRGVRFHRIQALLPDCQVVLSCLARVGHPDLAEVEAAFRAGMVTLPTDGYPRPLLDRSAAGLAPVDRALDRLAQSTPGCKRAVLRACAETACHDGVVQPREAELLRAIADSVDCPLPPLLETRTSEAASAAP